MPLPITKQELADWILRRLGAPVINVEISDVQLEDCIDEAVQFFQWYHFDGAEKAYRVIRLTREILTGNNRRHQQMNAPPYDISDKWRIGDRAMTYKVDNAPDKIWVKFDSDERITKHVFFQDDNGLYFAYDSDLFTDYDIQTDSDGVFILYDSEVHTFIQYYKDDTISDVFVLLSRPYSYTTGDLVYVDSDGGKVLYDSDKHQVLVYFIDSEGPYVDSDGVYVAYDSDKHTSPDYELWTTSSDKYVLIDGSYVLYDSDRDNTVTYVRDDDGSWVMFNEGQQALPLQPIYVNEEDSDKYGYFERWSQVEVAPTLYQLKTIAPIRYSSQYDYPNLYQRFDENLWVDSDGVYVQYDSDKHVVYQFDSEIDSTLGIWTDSEDGDKVLYDSDKHTIFVYTSDSEGNFIDSDGEKVLYDSDTHNLVEFYIDSELGNYVDSDGDKVLFDSDKHTIKIWYLASKPYNLLSSNIENYYWLKSEFSGPTVYEPFATAVDTAYTYAKLTQTLNRKTSLSDPTTITVNGNTFTVNSDIRVFELRGTTEPTTDSDGNGSGLSFTELDGLRVKVIINVGSIVTETYILDQTITQDVRAPLVDGLITIDTIAGTESLIFNGTYTRSWINQFTNLYTNKTFEPIKYVYGVKKIREDRFTRVSVSPYFYSRQFTYPELFNRRTLLKGERFGRRDSEIYRTNKQFDELWKEETHVLNEVQLDLDYSKEGQIGIPIPENIIGINKILRIDNFSGIGMWNYEYQFFLNNFDFFYGAGGAAPGAMTNYFIQKSYIDMIDHMMNIEPVIRFSKARNRLYIDTNWTRLANMAANKEYHLLVECYEANDPEVYGDVYKDMWLKRYATSLAKEQWGSNLKKYSNTELPGGVTLNGQDLYNEAKEERLALEEELKNSQLEMDSIIIG